jgi:hypothetical protein
MTPIEIADAISELALEPFDRAEFPFQFLASFGNKETTLKKLRAGASNASDLIEGVLQRNNIHIATCAIGAVNATLTALRESPKTASAKVKFIIATDGEDFQAEDLASGETVACHYTNFDAHFGFFLPLAGFTNVKEIKETELDRRAASRLKKLYVELLSANPEWAAAERREDMNKFMARLIFCFFAEDTDIIHPSGLFTKTVEQMGSGDASDTHHVISEIFRAMDAKLVDREAASLPIYAKKFPYVNGGLFSDSIDCPRFTKISRSYLFHIGNLDWKRINPDIFGSMMQAVADDEERGAIGMHYTSVPNILKVLNPLFLNDLREKLEEAGDNGRKLLNLRNRIATIRVFDPACGSGNFLVIAYKEMRTIEAVINKRRGEYDRRSDISVKNFRGIELRPFAVEIARLALIIAEYQCDVTHRGQQEALAEFLPLDRQNWITCGNALRLDWLSICPPTGTGVKMQANDLFEPVNQAAIDFENEGGETYICGNPPYKGARKQDPSEKFDLDLVFSGHADFKDADYVTGWFVKASQYCLSIPASFSFVSTSSICQGEQAQFLWPRIWSNDQEIGFAYAPFKWANNAAHNAGVFVVIVGIRPKSGGSKYIFDGEVRRQVRNISPYLTDGLDTVVQTAERPLSQTIPKMIMGNMARDEGHLILSREEAREIRNNYPEAQEFLLPLFGTKEIVDGVPRVALHLDDRDRELWSSIPPLADRVSAVKKFRLGSKAKTTNGYANIAHRFAQYCHRDEVALTLPSVTPEGRAYVTPLLLPKGVMVTNLAYLIYGFEAELFALLSSRMHTVWVEAVSGRLGSGIRYTPTVSYHTFPIPPLTEQNKADLTVCAEDILLAREAHFPATIADLYDPDEMPEDLRAAHEQNDEMLERIYIGRRFKNDTERLEKLFELYTKIIAKGKAV